MDNNDVQLNTYYPSEDPGANRNKSGFGNKLGGLIIKLSGGKMNERQANYVILALVAIIFIISFVILFNAISLPSPSSIQKIPGEF